MYANKCPNCGAFLDPCERCDCAKEPKPAPITAKRAAVDDKERVQRKTGIVMPDRPAESKQAMNSNQAEKVVVLWRKHPNEGNVVDLKAGTYETLDVWTEEQWYDYLGKELGYSNPEDFRKCHSPDS